MKIKFLFLTIVLLFLAYKNNFLSKFKDFNFYSNFSNEKNINYFLLKSKKIKKKFYEFEYYFTKKEKKLILNIIIKPLKGFKLNGDDYPPMNIELKEMIKKDNEIRENSKSKILLKPNKILEKGIKEGEAKSFLIAIENFDKNFLISVYLKMIACNNSSCFMINDKILLEYNE